MQFSLKCLSDSQEHHSSHSHTNNERHTCDDGTNTDEHLEPNTEPFYTNQEEDPANAFYLLDLWLDD